MRLDGRRDDGQATCRDLVSPLEEKRRTLMKYLAIFIVSGTLLASCGNGGSGGGSADPPSGTWHFNGGSVVDDTCGYPSPPTDPDGDFTITNNGDSTFTVDEADGTRMFDCTLSGSSFNCPDRLYEDIDASPLTAVVHVHVRATGSFSSDTQASGRETADVTCDGADCASVASYAGISAFPCSYSQDFTASYQSP
jgi:hypothetical protein